MDVTAALETLRPVTAIAALGRNALKLKDWLNAQVEAGDVDTSLEAALERLPAGAPPWEVAAALKPFIAQCGLCVVMDLATHDEQ